MILLFTVAYFIVNKSFFLQKQEKKPVDVEDDDVEDEEDEEDAVCYDHLDELII